MSVDTKIEWADSTLNVVTGCTKVSSGCDHCYAETFAERWRGIPGHYFERGFDVMLRPDKLMLPLRWKKPRRIFVNSMSDLFHDAVPDAYIAKVFAMMAATPQHTYQILTKRPGRMRSLLGRDTFDGGARLIAAAEALGDVETARALYEADGWPLFNVWLGVSVENQKWAEVRIPVLLDTAAAVRFLSCEPLLGPISLHEWIGRPMVEHWEPTPVSWVIVGGESGANHRPPDPGWVLALRDQCVSSRVNFFFKQWGGHTPKSGGRLLDGRTWDQMPAASGG